MKIIKSKIDYVLSKKLRSEDKIDIDKIGNCIQNFISGIDDIIYEKDILIRVELAKQIQLKYSKNDYLDLDKVIENYILDIKERS